MTIDDPIFPDSGIITVARSLDKLMLGYHMHRLECTHGRFHPYFRLLQMMGTMETTSLPLLNDRPVKLQVRRGRNDARDAFVSDADGDLFTIWVRHPLNSYGPGMLITLNANILDRMGDGKAVPMVRDWVHSGLCPEVDLKEMLSTEYVSAAEIKTDVLVTAGSENDLRTVVPNQWVTRLTRKGHNSILAGKVTRIGFRAYDKSGEATPDEIRQFLSRWKVPGLCLDSDGELSLWGTKSRANRYEWQFGRLWLNDQDVHSYDDLIAKAPLLVEAVVSDKISLLLSPKERSYPKDKRTFLPVWGHLLCEARKESKMQELASGDLSITLVLDDSINGTNCPMIGPSLSGFGVSGYCGKQFETEEEIDAARQDVEVSDWQTLDEIIKAETDPDRMISGFVSRPGLRSEPHSRLPSAAPPSSPMKIPLSRSDEVAWIDAADYALVSQYKWCRKKARCTTYAATTFKENGKCKTMTMHRLILGAMVCQEVDHIDRNGLNNRRSNLRIVTRAQNVYNSGPHQGREYKGVYEKGTGWIAIFNNQALGTFDSKDAAAEDYNRKLLSVSHDTASLNRLALEYLLDGPTTFRQTPWGIFTEENDRLESLRRKRGRVK